MGKSHQVKKIDSYRTHWVGKRWGENTKTHQTSKLEGRTNKVFGKGTWTLRINKEKESWVQGCKNTSPLAQTGRT